MRSREQRIEDQERILKVYEEVKAELLRIPGVVDVGIGVKETGGSPTEELAFRVYVTEKLPESGLSPDHVIPKSIRGFRTDVIRKYRIVPVIGFNDEDDWKNYGTKVGGIRIGSEDSGGTGTLGCFCRLTTDNTTVFLSNHHVLLGGSAKVGSGVGQPNHKESCCCTCNEIGQVLDGDKNLDCAIAKLNADVPFIPKVRKIRKNDGSTEIMGLLSGDGPAVHLDEVYKVGARTGLTRGTLTQVTPEIVITPVAPFTKIADRGDSGSAVVNRLNGNVVGLLYAIDKEGGPLGLAKLIAPVIARLHIAILPTDATQDYDVMEVEEDQLELATRLARDSAFGPLAERLRASEAGRQLLELILKHGEECLELVNRKRPVTVVWQRHQGPAFLAALARSAREPIYRFPDEIEGVSRHDAAARIREALVAHGSEVLRDDLQTYADLIIQAFTVSYTVDEFVCVLEEKLVPSLQLK